MIEYFIQSASSFSGDIDNLFLVITLIIGFWFILVFGALAYFTLETIFRARGTLTFFLGFSWLVRFDHVPSTWIAD